MGKMADLFDCYDEDDNSDYLTHIEENLRQCQWETKDNAVIKFRDMTTSHIKNVVAYIIRKHLHVEYATFSDYIDAFNTELERREKECLTLSNKIKNDCFPNSTR